MNQSTTNIWLSLALLCVVAAPLFAKSQGSFQEGKILSVKKLPPAPESYPWDATRRALTDPIDRYHVSMLVGGQVYVYEYEVDRGEDVPWAAGETREVRIDHGTIDVKRLSGDVDSYNIVQSAKAKAPSH
jgi:hypothetical protein